MCFRKNPNGIVNIRYKVLLVGDGNDVDIEVACLNKLRTNANEYLFIIDTAA